MVKLPQSSLKGHVIIFWKKSPRYFKGRTDQIRRIFWRIFGDPDYEIQTARFGRRNLDGEIGTARSRRRERSRWRDPTLWRLCWPCGDPAKPVGTLPTLWGPCQPFGDPAKPVGTLPTLWGPCQPCGDPANPVGTLPTLWGPCQPCGHPANHLGTLPTCGGPHQPHSNPVVTPPTMWQPHHPCGNPMGTLPTLLGPCQPRGDPVNLVGTLSTLWWPHQPISTQNELWSFNLSQKADDEELKKSCRMCLSLLIHHGVHLRCDSL